MSNTHNNRYNRTTLLRISLVYGLFLLVAIAIIGRVIYIQTYEGSHWKEKAESLLLKYRKVEAVRGNIFAEDGRLLATSVPIFDIRMDTRAPKPELFDSKIDSLANCLSQLFSGRTPSQYKKSITNARKLGNRYLLIKRKVVYRDVKALRKFPIFRKGKYGGGLILVPRTKREMPFQGLAARTIGYENETGKKVYVGLEGAFSKELQGVTGSKLYQKIAGGVWQPVYDDNDTEPQNGQDIYTTIDINLQDVAEDALLRQLINHDADHGCVAVMEVATGEIKAIANLGKNKKGYYEEDFNYMVGESSEPGSTFKLAALVAALEDGVTNITDTVDTGDGWTVYHGRTMRDVHKVGNGRITVKEAFEHSSNVGLSKIIVNGYKDHAADFIDRLYAMHLNEPLGIPIAGEGRPFIKHPIANKKHWYGTTLPWMAHGYEVLITPLQILSFYNAIANDGCLVKPMFVKEIRQSGNLIKQFEPEIIDPEICSPETAKKAQLLMEGVVENGTGKKLRNPLYKIAGKTGTAQIANSNGGYNKKNYKASFAGYFPANNPEYSCIVVINNPTKGGYYGGTIAGPVFKEIADKIYATRLHNETIDTTKMQLPVKKLTASGHYKDYIELFAELNKELPSTPDTAWVKLETNGPEIKVKNITPTQNQVPNVKGMGLRDALFLLETTGLHPVIKGKGKVKRQSLRAGSRYNEGQKIIIELAI